MTQLRAKFKVMSKIPYADKGGRVMLSAVYNTDSAPENKTFWEATPNGLLDMHISNQAAFDALEAQAEYYLDFTKAD